MGTTHTRRVARVQEGGGVRVEYGEASFCRVHGFKLCVRTLVLTDGVASNLMPRVAATRVGQPGWMAAAPRALSDPIASAAPSEHVLACRREWRAKDQRVINQQPSSCVRQASHQAAIKGDRTVPSSTEQQPSTDAGTVSPHGSWRCGMCSQCLWRRGCHEAVRPPPLGPRGSG